MKKMIKTLAAILAATLTLTVQVAAADGYSWYCMRKKNHERPCAESNMAFISECGGYYLGADEKVIYLTFDAGYENGNISKILDTLKAHDVRAAFFVLENTIKREPELMKRMAEDGHLICNHTMKHKNMANFTDAEFEKELTSLEALASENGIELSKFYRPPEGRFSRANLEKASEMGYKTILWSFAYADWDNNKQPSESYAIDLILNNVHNGEIMLLHPTSATNAAILDRVLTALENDGYRFGTLDELE